MQDITVLQVHFRHWRGKYHLAAAQVPEPFLTSAQSRAIGWMSWFLFELFGGHQSWRPKIITYLD